MMFQTNRNSTIKYFAFRLMYYFQQVETDVWNFRYNYKYQLWITVIPLHTMIIRRNIHEGNCLQWFFLFYGKGWLKNLVGIEALYYSIIILGNIIHVILFIICYDQTYPNMQK